MIRDRLVELEQAARERLAPAAYDYFAGGAAEERTLAEAEGAWAALRFRPRCLRDVSHVDTGCELFGVRYASPVAVAPTAYHCLAHEEGELATAAGARAANALYVMATRATRPIEQVAAAAGEGWWFQVYVLRDRGLTRALVERAVAAGATALVLTGDTPVVGPKARASGPPPLDDDEYLANLGLHLRGATDSAVAAATAQDPSVTEEAIGWLADLSGLPIVVKGVLRADDAERFALAGAAGLVVSNHGGRQLDRALPSATALEEVVAAAGPDLPVLVDGGLRSGSDVLAALCLGARAVLLGRPVIWALAAGGATGVASLLEGVRSELAEAMMLAGATDLAGCDRTLVARPAS